MNFFVCSNAGQQYLVTLVMKRSIQSYEKTGKDASTLRTNCKTYIFLFQTNETDTNGLLLILTMFLVQRVWTI